MHERHETLVSLRGILSLQPRLEETRSRECEKGFLSRRLEIVLALHVLHNVSQLPMLANIQPLDLGV